MNRQESVKFIKKGAVTQTTPLHILKMKCLPYFTTFTALPSATRTNMPFSGLLTRTP